MIQKKFENIKMLLKIILCDGMVWYFWILNDVQLGIKHILHRPTAYKANFCTVVLQLQVYTLLPKVIYSKD